MVIKISAENPIHVGAVIPAAMREAALIQVEARGYLNLSDFIRAAIRDKLANPQGEPVGAGLPEEPQRADKPSGAR